MTRKKSKFLTFWCSLIPGAGEMYLGFLKQGVSIMTAFFLLFAIGSLMFPPVTVFCAVIWFYSFFHTHNLNSMPDDEFYAIEDEYLIHISQIIRGKDILLNQYRKLLAFVMILSGISIIWKIVNNFFFHFVNYIFYLPDHIMMIFSWFSEAFPQTITAIAIIIAGIYLIRNKKKELDDSDFD